MKSPFLMSGTNGPVLIEYPRVQDCGRNAVSTSCAMGNYRGVLTPDQHRAFGQTPVTRSYWVGDTDGDGQIDVVNYGAQGFRRLPIGTTLTVTPMPGSQFVPGATAYNPFVDEQRGELIGLPDFNGDGKTDFIVQSEDFVSNEIGWEATLSRIALISSQSGYESVPVSGVYCGSTAFGGSQECPGWSRIFVADFNGDGLTDILNRDIASRQWKLVFGTSSGLSEPQDVSMPTMDAGLAVDFTADGRADILYSESVNGQPVWRLLRWTGGGFESTASDILPAGAKHPRVADFSGDGVMDIGYFRDGAYRTRVQQTQKPDLLSTVTDGFGNRVAVTYVAPLDASVYAASNRVQNGFVDTQEFPGAPTDGRVVVKSHRVTDGSGGEYTIEQRYVGARYRFSGFLGYEERKEIDRRTDTTRHTDYVHVVTDDPWSTPEYGTMRSPYTGRPVRTWVKQADGTLVSETSYRYAIRRAGIGSENWEQYYPWVRPDDQNGGYTERLHVYADEVIQRSYEVGGPRNGALISETKTTINLMDDYGNATDVTTVVQDMDELLPANERTFTTRVVQSIANDAANWCLGRSHRTDTTSTLGNGASRTQINARTIDYVKCRVTDEVTNADSSGQPTALSVSTHYDFAPAACGRASSISVTGRRSDGTALPARTTSFDYGAKCLAPETVTDPLGQSTIRTYDYALGVLKTEKTPNDVVANRQTVYDYDSFGRLEKTTYPDGTSAIRTLSSCNVQNNYCGVSDLRVRVDTVTRATDNSVISSATEYLDSLGRSRISDAPLPLTGEISHVVSTYDQHGRLKTRTVPYTTTYQGLTEYGYDLVGRQTSAKLFNGSGTLVRQSSQRYEGRRTVSVDPRTNEREKIYDALGQVRRVKDPTSSLYTSYDYTYSGSNLVSTVTDKAGNVLSTTVDLNGNKIQTQDPDMGNWSFEYTTFGELTKQTDAKGQVVTFADYDLLGRPTARYEPEGATTFTYGTPAQYAYGKLKSVSGGGYTETYFYDTLGRPSTTQIAIPGEPTYQVAYDYQPTTGLVDTITYPASVGPHPLKIKYGYNQGVATSVRDYTNNTLGTTYWQMTAMDAAGRATDETLGNGLRVRTGFDPTTGHMTSRQSGTGGSTANRQNLSYQWDANGNLERRTDHNQGGLFEHFYYDALNRLDYSTRNGTTNLDMSYDEIGNITYKSDVGSYNYSTQQSACTYGQSHVQPHAVRNAGGHSYCYDANGNMTRRGAMQIDWYSDNTVRKITQGSITSEFWYTPTGDRYKQHAVYATGTETTVYIGGMVEKVTAANGDIAYRHYIGAGSNVAIHTRWTSGAAQTFYATTDHMGSSSTITNESGSVIVSESFDAFGKRRATNWTAAAPSTAEMQAMANTTRMGYTGHEHLDNVGLIHMNGRVQDPTLGRFLSADPYIQAPEFSQSLNRYSYVWNNPLSMIDPSGFEGCPPPDQKPSGDASAYCLAQIVVTGEMCDAACQDYRDRLMAEYAQEHLRYMQEIREQLVNDIARGVWEEFVADPARAAWGAAKDLADGNLKAAGVGAVDAACKFVKLCRVGERVLGKGVEKATDLLRKIGCNCFIAGTLVMTAAGAVPIESIREGDQVLARNEVTGETAYKPVTKLYVNDEGSVWELTIVDANGVTDVHEVTGNHPYWTADGEWVAVEDLVVGSNLTTEGGILATLISKRDTGEVVRTYNLEVADFHTYFVGEQRVLVHNGKHCMFPNKQSGSYTNTHQSGKQYAGKGGRERAAESGAREATRNNDPLARTDWSSSRTHRDGYKDESRRLDDAGGVESTNTYNRIETPGKNYRIEDGEL